MRRIRNYRSHPAIDQEVYMSDKLQQSEQFPSLTLNLTSGVTVRIPEDAPGRYLIVLFYRGHW